MRIIDLGQTGTSVEDVQRRLDELGLPVGGDVPGEFGSGTLSAVRAFQQSRGLPADGIVGRDTWRSLVEAGFSLGDRLLYLTRPMLRGDDVRDLQARLNRLGFDSGQVDGILGPDTRAAIVDFQGNVGLVDDGTAGPETIGALLRLHRSHQAVPAAVVRERHVGLPVARPSLSGVPILVDAAHGPDDPGFRSPDGVTEHEVTWAIANRLQGRLAALGARPVLARGPGTTPSASDRASQANREGVEAIVSVHCNGLPGSSVAEGVSASYFGHRGSTSEHGRRLAELAVDRISDVTGSPNCRAHPSTSALLRESRAAAVIVEVGFLTHPKEGLRLADPDHQGVVAACLTDALTTWMVG
jgi:N-acetylmuramoyl-L-alanine amidase